MIALARTKREARWLGERGACVRQAVPRATMATCLPFGFHHGDVPPFSVAPLAPRKKGGTSPWWRPKGRHVSGMPQGRGAKGRDVSMVEPEREARYPDWGRAPGKGRHVIS